MSNVNDFSDSKCFYTQTGLNIKKYRDLRNYSLQMLAEKVGLTKKTIQRYEQGIIKIDMNRLKDLAAALDVSVTQLTEGAYRYLGVEVNETTHVSVPIVGKIACGDGVLLYETIEGYEATPREWVSGGAHFYVRAKGDNMTGARIVDGDLLLLSKQEEVEDGEIAAVWMNDQVTLKKVFKTNGNLILQSTNPNYPPIMFDSKLDLNIRMIGRLKKIVINM